MLRNKPLLALGAAAQGSAQGCPEILPRDNCMHARRRWNMQNRSACCACFLRQQITDLLLGSSSAQHLHNLGHLMFSRRLATCRQHSSMTQASVTSKSVGPEFRRSPWTNAVVSAIVLQLPKLQPDYVHRRCWQLLDVWDPSSAPTELLMQLLLAAVENRALHPGVWYCCASTLQPTCRKQPPKHSVVYWKLPLHLHLY